jgi:hypothetical protein
LRHHSNFHFPPDTHRPPSWHLGSATGYADCRIRCVSSRAHVSAYPHHPREVV